MSCQDGYITKNSDVTSRSGLYASDLPGVEELLYELVSKDSETDDQVWERIYRNAWTNMISDVEVKLREKSFVQYKLISRETSAFEAESNIASGLSGIKIEFFLPRYARLHIVTVKLISQQAYSSPEFRLEIFDTDENGDLLFEKEQALSVGKNSVNVDTDFEVNKLFVAYDPAVYELRKTANKEYSGCSSWNKTDCMFPCFGGEGSIQQVNGGGLNVIYNVFCSAEKFVCENINLFKKVFWWKIGQELVIERTLGNRINQFTTFTTERGEQLMRDYLTFYSTALNNAIDTHNINEDPICFECKGLVNTKSVLP